MKNYLYRQREIDMKIMKLIIWFGLVIVFLHIEINTLFIEINLHKLLKREIKGNKYEKYETHPAKLLKHL